MAKQKTKKARDHEVDLQFLLAPRPSENGWTIKKARKLVRLLKTRKKIDVIAKETGMAVGGVTQIIVELKRAARKKMTLVQYFEAGRPFRYGKKIVD